MCPFTILLFHHFSSTPLSSFYSTNTDVLLSFPFNGRTHYFLISICFICGDFCLCFEYGVSYFMLLIFLKSIAIYFIYIFIY